MATVDKTTGGTSGHPSTRRKPYFVENTIDFDVFNPEANDVVQALNVPAETLVEVLTALSGSVTLDLGDGGDVDRYVDGDTNAVGHATTVANASNSGHVYATADTIDVTVLGATAAVGKVRVYAVMCDVSGSDETASNSS
jgi:hypothetical protein